MAQDGYQWMGMVNAVMNSPLFLRKTLDRLAGWLACKAQSCNMYHESARCRCQHEVIEMTHACTALHGISMSGFYGVCSRFSVLCVK